MSGFSILDGFGLHWYNADMHIIKKINPFWLLIIVLLASSCTQTATDHTTLTSTATQGGTLRPYPSGTPTETPLPTGYSSPTPTATVTPTPTPVYYEIQLGDDMYSIGWRFSVSPQAIMTANPDIDPRAMIVGTPLLIPITPTAEPTTAVVTVASPTEMPSVVNLGEPACYHEASGGVWCFILAENDQEQALENVSALVTLQTGEETRQETAIMPLNLLPAGTSLPLIAYFDPPIDSNFSAEASLDFYLPVMADDERYLAVEITEKSIRLREDERIAEVQGKISISTAETDAAYLWVNATAFDADGHVVAVRRWTVNETLSAGAAVSFDLTLYSLGGVIDRVEILAEAHRVEEPAGEE